MFAGSLRTPRARLIILLLCLPLLLAACGGGGGGDSCELADFVAPENLDPVGGIVPDFTPLHVWSYSGCEPYGWRVEVTTYGGYGFGTTQTHDMVGAAATNWIFDEALQPATHYEWHVAAWDGSDVGPWSTSTAYWTGPVCELDELNAPIPGTPPDGAGVDNPFPPMGWGWDPGDCIPEQAHLQLDVDPTFPGPNLVAYSPGVFDGPHIGQIPIAELDDCTIYYWRVRGENAGGNSDWSPTQSFRTDFTGVCDPPPICPDDALLEPPFISPQPFEIVDVNHTFEWEYPVATCTPEGYAIQVNIRFTDQDDPTHWGGTGSPATLWAVGEPMQPITYYEWRVAGINNTTLGPWSPWVPFWTGPLCDPAAISTPQLLTPEDGSVVTDPATFLRWDHVDCTPEETHAQVSEDMGFGVLHTDVAFDTFGGLLPNPLDDCTTYYWRVRGEANDSADAGAWSEVWSFFTIFEGACADAPVPEGAELVEAFSPQNNNCREGDNNVFEISGFFLEGETSSVIGKNQAGTWLLLPKKTGGGNCWVATGLVQLTPDNGLDLLEVYPSPPLPTPTATPTVAPNGQVVSVRVTVDPDEFKGTCPKTFVFSAAITTNGPAYVEYRWVRSDQTQEGLQALTFGAAETKVVTYEWTLGTPGQTYDDWWAAVQVAVPNNLNSNLGTFYLACGQN